MSSTEEMQRKQMREILNRQKAAQQASWDECKHLQGSNLLSEYTGEYKTKPDQVGLPGTSIVWHKFGDGVYRGICTVCQRWFNPEDHDYIYWRSQLSGNNSSSSDNGEWKPITEEEYKEGSKDQIRVGDDLEW